MYCKEYGFQIYFLRMNQTLCSGNKFFKLKNLFVFCVLYFALILKAKPQELKYIFEGITNDKGLTHNTVFDSQIVAFSFCRSVSKSTI